MTDGSDYDSEPEPCWSVPCVKDGLNVTLTFPMNGMTADEARETAARTMDQLTIHHGNDKVPTMAVHIPHSGDEWVDIQLEGYGE